MNHKNILVTGGAGFIGSNICVKLKECYPNIAVTALDNLIREGSKLNLPRLKKFGVHFQRGDVRKPEDLLDKKTDLIIECSADPSVLAGIGGSPKYVIDTNLGGAINCFELARKTHADVVFLSTSRVYSIEKLNAINIIENETRYSILKKQQIPGITQKGISEEFPTNGIRSMYGATKLSAEQILQEYCSTYGIRGIINRYGVIAGPWQMGHVEQGIIVHWLASHLYDNPLAYIGFGGKGKQIRDVLHIDDLFDLLLIQLSDIGTYASNIYNVGGGSINSISLTELSALCRKISGNKIRIKSVNQDRVNDIRIYISDNTKIEGVSDWKPKRSIQTTLEDIYVWIIDNKPKLQKIFCI